MPDRVVNIPGVGKVSFPESMSPDDMNAAAAKIYKEKQGAFAVGAYTPDSPLAHHLNAQEIGAPQSLGEGMSDAATKMFSDIAHPQTVNDFGNLIGVPVDPTRGSAGVAAKYAPDVLTEGAEAAAAAAKSGARVVGSGALAGAQGLDTLAAHSKQISLMAAGAELLQGKPAAAFLGYMAPTGMRAAASVLRSLGNALGGSSAALAEAVAAFSPEEQALADQLMKAGAKPAVANELVIKKKMATLLAQDLPSSPTANATGTGTAMAPPRDQPTFATLNVPDRPVVAPQTSGTSMQPGTPVPAQPTPFNRVNAPAPAPPPPRAFQNTGTTMQAPRPSPQPTVFNQVPAPPRPAAPAAPSPDDIAARWDRALFRDDIGAAEASRAARQAPAAPSASATREQLAQQLVDQLGGTPPVDARQAARSATKALSAPDLIAAADGFTDKQKAVANLLRDQGWDPNDAVRGTIHLVQTLKAGGLNATTVKSLVGQFDKATVAAALKTLGGGAYQAYKALVQ